MSEERDDDKEARLRKTADKFSTRPEDWKRIKIIPAGKPIPKPAKPKR